MQLSFGLYYKEMYSCVRICIHTFWTPWANYSVAFPKKVWQCRNAAVC